MMIRCESDTGDVIGLEIELFEYHFLQKHTGFANDWAALKPEGDDGFHNSSWLTGDVTLDYANRLKESARQGTLVADGPSADRGDVLVWQKSDEQA